MIAIAHGAQKAFLFNCGEPDDGSIRLVIILEIS